MVVVEMCGRVVMDGKRSHGVGMCGGTLVRVGRHQAWDNCEGSKQDRGYTSNKQTRLTRG